MRAKSLLSVLGLLFLGITLPLLIIATQQKQEIRQVAADQKGNVQFTNLQPSVYDALVANYSGDHIINVTGSNHTLVLGITVQPKQSSLLRSITNPVILIGILLAGIVVGGGIVAGLLWWKMKKK
ncbi:MAG TPA: hypothetical protein VGT05_02185 [Patescibacteria group bacterium]|nr:hypothetical protein [Patescibacteria group bacterium]